MNCSTRTSPFRDENPGKVPVVVFEFWQRPNVSSTVRVQVENVKKNFLFAVCEGPYSFPMSGTNVSKKGHVLPLIHTLELHVYGMLNHVFAGLTWLGGGILPHSKRNVRYTGSHWQEKVKTQQKYYNCNLYAAEFSSFHSTLYSNFCSNSHVTRLNVWGSLQRTHHR